MLTQRLANIIFAAVIIAASIWFAVIAEGFEAAGLLASSGLPSKFFPQLLLAFTAVCALLVGLLYLLRGEAGGDRGETVFEDFPQACRGLLVLAVAVGCYFIWQAFGFIPTAVVMGPMCLLVMGVRSPIQYAVVLGLTALIYLTFTHLLNVQLG